MNHNHIDIMPGLKVLFSPFFLFINGHITLVLSYSLQPVPKKDLHLIATPANHIT